MNNVFLTYCTTQNCLNLLYSFRNGHLKLNLLYKLTHMGTAKYNDHGDNKVQLSLAKIQYIRY